MAAIGGMAIAAPASAIEITVTPWLAPNAFGSPSYASAVQNAISGQLAGSSTAGTSGTPTFYQAQSDVTAQESIVTGFASWKGQADPGTVFGPAFANELGNRMSFGVLIDGQGTQFSVSQMSFTASSDDPGNVLGFGFGLGSYNYSQDYQGILYGTDGHLGGGDDTFITSGANTQLVDGFIGRGSGNSLAAYCAGCSLADQQAAINSVAGTFTGTTHFTGTYQLADLATGSGTFTINGGAVPEPATWAMMLIGFGGLGAVMRKRRAMGRDVLAAA